jgi:DNA-binding NarL/FixJ family response regulator
MANAPAQITDWPAAVILMDDTLRRLGQRLTSAEADLRLACDCYEALMETSSRYMSPLRPSAARLTTQELRVANFVAIGMSNREVAAALHVSVHTVKTHVKRVLDKLEVRSRWQLSDALAQSHNGDATPGL